MASIMGFLPFIHQRGQKGKSKDNLGVMKISLIGKIPTRDGLNNFRENSIVQKGDEKSGKRSRDSEENKTH